LSFFYPGRTPWDAPNTASAAPEATADDSVAVPPPEVLDVRGAASVAQARASQSPQPARMSGIGSNNWAVAGRLTATGSALVANDMHLTQRVPPTWYRAR